MSEPSATRQPANPDVGAARQVAEALAYICDHFDEVLEDVLTLLAAADLGSKLIGALRADVAAGRPAGATLDAIHEALQAGGDRLGLYGRFASTSRGSAIGVTLSGVSAAPPFTHETVLICPIGRCSRKIWPDAQQQPHCAFTGEPLSEDRL